jgi:hypothetical protein
MEFWGYKQRAARKQRRYRPETPKLKTRQGFEQIKE